MHRVSEQGDHVRVEVGLVRRREEGPVDDHVDEVGRVGRVRKANDVVVLALADVGEVEEGGGAEVGEEGVVEADTALFLDDGVEAEKPVGVVAVGHVVFGLVGGIEGGQGEVVERRGGDGPGDDGPERGLLGDASAGEVGDGVGGCVGEGEVGGGGVAVVQDAGAGVEGVLVGAVGAVEDTVAERVTPVRGMSADPVVT